MKSRGSLLLERTGKTRAAIASAAGVDTSTVTLWVAGKRTPSPPLREKLRELFDIPAASWEQATGAPTPTAPSRPAGRSQGSVLLAQSPLALRDIADALGVASSLVKRWSCGESVPGATMRAKISKALKIDEGAWLVDARDAAGVTAAADGEPGLMSDVPAIRKEVQALMKSVRDDPNSPPLERAKVLASCASTIAVLGKLTGEFDNNRNLLKLPVWKRIKGAMERSLKAYPDALRALSRELRELGDAQLAESEL